MGPFTILLDTSCCNLGPLAQLPLNVSKLKLKIDSSTDGHASQHGGSEGHRDVESTACTFHMYIDLCILYVNTLSNECRPIYMQKHADVGEAGKLIMQGQM